jgi:hypothetical protein
MFHAPNAHFAPSLINQTAEDEEFYHRSKKRPFRELTNSAFSTYSTDPANTSKDRKMSVQPTEEKVEKREVLERKEEEWKEEVERDEVITSDTTAETFEVLMPAKRSNLIMQFDSDSEEEQL